MKKAFILLFIITIFSFVLISCGSKDAVTAEAEGQSISSENSTEQVADALEQEALTEEGDSVTDADGENTSKADESLEAAEAESQNDTDTAAASASDSKGNTNESTNTAASTSAASKKETVTSPAVTTADTSDFDFEFSTEEAVTTAAKKEEQTEAAEPQIPPVPASYMITQGGTYSLSGTVTDKTITVNTPSSEVTLVLNGATVSNSKGPAIYVRAASKITIKLASGTTNTLSDGSSYSITESGSKLDAAIFSKADLTINGSGTLNVNGNYKHGIVSKDELVISSGVLNVNSKSIGINGKDCVKIQSGSITVSAGTSGITSDNSTEAGKGFVYLYGGSIRITSGNDGIIAQNILNIENVALNVKAGGGAATNSYLAGSFKGLKAGSDIYIIGGSFNIDSRDDSIHSNGTIIISGGSYILSTKDDAVHANTDLAISGSETVLNITRCNEGIEAKNLVISGGTVSIAASGNGLDANGTLSVCGGNTTISISGGNDTSVFKYDTSGAITQGIFFGTGTHTNNQGFESSSTQGVISIGTDAMPSGTEVTVTDTDGNIIFKKTVTNAFSYICFSSPELVKGAVYTVNASSFSYTATAE